MLVASYIIMSLAGIGMFWANRAYKRAKRKSHVPWARPFAGFCGMVATGLAVANLFVTMVVDDGPSEKDLAKWEYVRCNYMGQYLGEHSQGQKALIIVDRTTDYNRLMAEARLNGLKEGFGGRVDIVSTVSPEPVEIGQGPDGTPYLEEQFTAKAFDELIAKHPDCNLVISLIGLPMDYQAMDLWKKPKNKVPDLAVVDAPLFELKKAIKSGYIDVVVAYKPLGPEDIAKGAHLASPPKNLDVAFNQRFLLAHTDNVNTLGERYHGLFAE